MEIISQIKLFTKNLTSKLILLVMVYVLFFFQVEVKAVVLAEGKVDTEVKEVVLAAKEEKRAMEA